jgi:phosphoribosylamine--glycine ligase
MRVLVIGSGGREHALAHGIARSPRLEQLYILPGNAGTATLGKNVPGDPNDTARVLAFVQAEGIDLTVIGPEDPLAAGLTDALEDAGHRVFGPRRAAARLEADKAFAKKLMKQYAIPTADARTFTDFEQARQFLVTRDEAVVVKAAGLAKGKGAIVCEDPADALIAAEKILVHGQFGEAGRTIVVEERLLGPEVSLLALVDGHTSYILESAQDHKRLGDGDTGPNTGGMGAFSPSPLLDDATLATIQSQILVPTLDALVHEEIPYRGVLYFGLMLTTAGPKVLEYNCRFGDPETQAVLLRLRSDLLDVLDRCSRGELESVELEWDPRPALCVVMASGGYPESYPKGLPIRGIPAPADDAVVYHAGTALKGGAVVTAGGRVLGVTALGETVAAARERAYGVVEQIEFDGAQYRTDLGAAAVAT